MDVTLVEGPAQPVLVDRDSLSAAPTLHLHHEVQQLGREIAELRQQVGYGKSMYARAAEKNNELEEEIDRLRAEHRQLRERPFGRQSEKKKPNDRSPSTGRS